MNKGRRPLKKTILMTFLPVLLALMVFAGPAFLMADEPASAVTAGSQWNTLKGYINSFFTGQYQSAAEGEYGFTIDRATLKSRIDSNGDMSPTGTSSTTTVTGILGEGDDAANAPVLVDNIIGNANMIPGTSVRCHWNSNYGTTTADNCFDAPKVTEIASKVNAHEAAGFSTDIVVYCVSGRTESPTTGALGTLAQTGALGGTTTPKVLAYKWGRNGWTATSTSTTSTAGTTGSVSAPSTTYGDGTGSASICSGAPNDQELVRCTAQWAIFNGTGDTANWLTPSATANGAGYNITNGATSITTSNQVVDLRSPSPASTITVTGAPATVQIPVNQVFNTGLQYLDTRTTATKNMFVGRTQHVPGMVAVNAIMLGYHSSFYVYGVNSWNTSLAGESYQTGNGLDTPNYPLQTATLNDESAYLDTTAPTITTASAASNITATSADISRVAGEPATMKVEYGTSPGTYTNTANSTVLNASKTVPLTGLSEYTTYYVRVTSYDGQANGTAETEFSFTTADVTAPAVTYGGPTGTIYTAGTTVTATATDGGSGLNNSSATVSLNGGAPTACTVISGAISCPVSSLAVGSYSAVVSINDVAGNTGFNSPAGSFTVADNVAPTVTYGGPTGTINTASTTITGTWSDPAPSSGINTASATVTIDAGTPTACSVTGNDISCPVTGLSEGAHTAVISISDNTPNTGTNSPAGSFTVNTSAPTVTADTIGYQPGNWTNDTTPALSATITDVPGGQSILGGTVTIDGSACDGTVTANDTSVSCTPATPLSAGAHSVVYSAWYSVGNAGVSPTQTINIDTTGPAISSLSPSGNVASSNVTISANLADTSGSGVKASASTISVDGGAAIGAGSCTKTTTSISCTTTVALGDHTFSVYAEDNAGNTTTNSTGSFSFTQRYYYATWYDNNPAGGMVGNWLMINNEDATTATVDIYIDDMTTPVANDVSVAAGSVTGWSSPTTVTTGPVKVVSTTGQALGVSQRVIYQDSFNEVEAVEGSALTSEYNFPWYDYNPATGMNGNWVMVANVGDTDTTVDIFVGDMTTPVANDVAVAAGTSVPWQSPTALTDGPVKVVGANSGDKLVASQRVLYGASFNEAMGIATSRLDDQAWFTWYDSAMGGNWVMVANLGSGDTTVDIFVDDMGTPVANDLAVTQNGTAYWQSPTPLTDGPVKVVGAGAGDKLAVTQRVLYKGSFEETAPTYVTELGSDADFTWYDSAMGGNWVMVVNADTTDANVNIAIAGTSAGTLNPVLANGGKNYWISPTTLTTGPVRVTNTGSAKLVISQRVIYKNSFNELVGRPR